MTDTNPLDLDRFTVYLDYNRSGQVVIIDRDYSPITGATAEAVIGDRTAAVIWYTSDRYGYLVFPADEAGWAMAQTLADQLNDLDAANDAEQAAALIDSAAEIAERIEAEAAPDLTPWQRRGLAAYQRAAALPPYQWGADCGERWVVGDRVRIGDANDQYYAGIMVALGLATKLHGQTATVILGDTPTCPLIVLLDDDSAVVALPHPALYVRRAAE